MMARRRFAALWGPGLFTFAAVSAARLQPGYRHRTHHVSGLAAQGQRSSRVMVPGFIALGLANLLMPLPSRSLTMLARAAGVTVTAAGLIPASTPDCPRPGLDDDAAATDVGHTVVSVATFALWLVMPFVATRQFRSTWFGTVSRVFGSVGAVAMIGTAATIQVNSPWKGAAQRAFLLVMFAWQGLSSICGPCRADGATPR